MVYHRRRKYRRANTLSYGYDNFSPIEGSSLFHRTLQSDLTSSPSESVHTSTPTTYVPRTHRSQEMKRNIQQNQLNP